MKIYNAPSTGKQKKNIKESCRRDRGTGIGGASSGATPCRRPLQAPGRSSAVSASQKTPQKNPHVFRLYDVFFYHAYVCGGGGDVCVLILRNPHRIHQIYVFYDHGYCGESGGCDYENHSRQNRPKYHK